MDDDLFDDVDDIFDDHEDVTDARDGENEGGNEASAEGEAGEVIPIPKKRIIRNPRPKFDPDRLCGEKGLPILIDQFKNVKFKGHGHEVKDLDHLLSILEHWTHRLFPSMRFEESLLQIEKLGKKKPVQTCVSKIRMDMPILANDFIGNDDDDDLLRNDDVQEPEVSAFDQLLNDGRESLRDDNTVSRDSNDIRSSPPSTPSASTSTSSAVELTDEQKARIERNKQIAAEKLKARLSAVSDAIQRNEIQDKAINESVRDEESAISSQPHVDVNNEMSLSREGPDSLKNATLEENEEIRKKPKKRLRIESSSSEEEANIDDLVESSLYNSDDND